MNKTALWEAVKEIARLALFAGVTAAVSAGIEFLTSLNSTELWVVIGTAVLRFADKWIHENKDVELKGLAPF